MNRPIVLASIAACLMALPCSAEPPRFVTKKDFSSKDIADAVNHYVRLGEARAMKEMAADIARHCRGSRVPVRICFVCRILFDGRGKEPLWPPAFGALNVPTETMPREKWPRYPIVESGVSFFLLSENYEGSGVPERPLDYIDYCRAKGVFRKKEVAVPSREQALADLQKLRKSSAWKAIQWEYEGPGVWYSLSEERLVRYLKAQADRTPPK